MKRRDIFLSASALVFTCLTASAVVADGTRLTASEIQTLLTDQMVAGDWNGTAYTQSFSANGQTLYVPTGGRPEAGRWRVNAATNSYESFWEPSGWSSYGIEHEGDALYWIDSAGVRRAFEIVER